MLEGSPSKHCVSNFNITEGSADTVCPNNALRAGGLDMLMADPSRY